MKFLYLKLVQCNAYLVITVDSGGLGTKHQGISSHIYAFPAIYGL